jgi:L-lactate dehydrogenase complex protein LldG
MNAGRERVLAQIRSSLGRSAPVAGNVAPLAGRGPRPAFEADVLERFVAKMLDKAATLVRIGSLAQVGGEVDRFLRAHGADRRACVSPALARIAWPAELDIQYRAAVRADQTSVTPCFAAVAESGGIVTLSGPDTPSTLNFVPENHVVIVHAVQVVRHFEDIWALWRASARPMPRTINIISGPSRTADIEQTIQLGAHGPRRLHILLVEG